MTLQAHLYSYADCNLCFLEWVPFPGVGVLKAGIGYRYLLQDAVPVEASVLAGALGQVGVWEVRCYLSFQKEEDLEGV